MTDSLELLDYRRRVAEIYRTVRNADPTEETWLGWLAARDALFATHPQTPLENPKDFTGLPYFEYDSKWRVEARFEPGEDTDSIIGHSGEGATKFISIGQVEFELDGEPCTLEVLWLDAYGGGIFIPFRDGTGGTTTYGGGRYLIDSVKGAELGQTDRGLILDFNYAYHPSCVHSYRWSCPLAPPANHLTINVTAGEMLAQSDEVE
jgi:uncharacterized protein (DUF1684 family)